MIKCEFCTKSNQKGKCFWSTQPAREFDCEKAIKRMTEALKGTDKRIFKAGERV
jgi:hypothetical protein